MKIFTIEYEFEGRSFEAKIEANDKAQAKRKFYNNRSQRCEIINIK